jgi:hypothetical protein
MGTPRLFDEILKDRVKISAAWYPVTNAFDIGDYGVLSEGIFVKLGNIRNDFAIFPQREAGPPSILNFTSKGTNIVRVAGNIKVEAFDDTNVDSKLRVEFSRENSFLLKARLTVSQMANLNQVAYSIYHHPQWEHWRYKYRVVSATYTGENCALISSTSANSSIELEGKANALKQLDVGAVAVGVGIRNRNEIGLDIVGQSGVVGLSFFKLTWWSGADPKVLSSTDTLPSEMLVDPESLTKDDV